MKKLLLSLMILLSGNLYADDFTLLEMNPSANLYGMYKTGASRITDDTYSYFANPALSSLTLTPNMVSINYSAGSSIFYTDKTSDNIAISLNQKNGKWTYGLGIFHQTLDMGDIYKLGIVDGILTQTKTGEYPNHYQTGVNLSSTFGTKFKFGFGLNLKYIYWGYENNQNSSSGIFATDFGMIASYNILENKKLSDKIGIDLMISAGISKTNMVFDHERTINSDDRMGYSIQTGLNYSFEKNNIKLLGIDWTSEAVSANDSKEFFNKISFFKDVFLLDGLSSIGAYKISLMEILSFMSSIVDDKFNTKIDSYGFGLSTVGITKILNEYCDNKVINWLNANLVLDYTYGKITHTYREIENKNTFHSIQLSYKNLDLFGNNKKSAKKKK